MLMKNGFCILRGDCSENINFEVKDNRAMSGEWYKNSKTNDCNSCQQLCTSEGAVCKGYEFDKTPFVEKIVIYTKIQFIEMEHIILILVVRKISV